MAEIRVRLKNGDGNILHPETEWSVIKGVTASNNIYTYRGYDSNHYPFTTVAIRYQDYRGASSVFYLDSDGSWKSGSESSLETPLVFKTGVDPQALEEEAGPQESNEE